MLGREFFQDQPLQCARRLIGCRLVAGGCVGRIIETEAYAAVGDEACHTFRRPSARTFVVGHPVGTAYVYMNYGMHWLFNVLVKKGAHEGFVLVRALMPLESIELMEQRRGTAVLKNLCSGPGKLAQAMGITGADHGRDLCVDPAFCILDRAPDYRGRVKADVRIGISLAKDLPWRFLEKGNSMVSVPASKAVKDKLRSPRVRGRSS